MEKGTSVEGWLKKNTCAYKEQYPGARRQNIANYFFHL
jgi:hypothetical protein